MTFWAVTVGGYAQGEKLVAGS